MLIKYVLRGIRARARPRPCLAPQWRRATSDLHPPPGRNAWVSPSIHRVNPPARCRSSLRRVTSPGTTMSKPFTPPANGQPITMGSGQQARRARQPDHPVHRRRRHGPRHLARERARARRRRREGVRRQAQDRLVRRSTPARRRTSSSTTGCPTRPSRPSASTSSASRARSTTPDRRRHPLAQRRAAPDARPLRLPAAGALVQGRALARSSAREGRHGHLPREHRGHLRRHRVRGRSPRRARRCSRSSRRSSRRITARSASRRPTGIGIKPVSRERAPSGWCARRSSTRSTNKRKSVTFVHKGNIMKFTEGAFRDWGYALAEREFADDVHLGPVGDDEGRQGRGRRERRAEGRARDGQAPHQGRHRRHHAAAGADAARRSSTSSRR